MNAYTSIVASTWPRKADHQNVRVPHKISADTASAVKESNESATGRSTRTALETRNQSFPSRTRSGLAASALTQPGRAFAAILTLTTATSQVMASSRPSDRLECPAAERTTADTNARRSTRAIQNALVTAPKNDFGKC